MKLIKNHKTLTEWFADLPLEDKLNLYNYYPDYNLKPIIDIFYDPPIIDVGTEPLNSQTGGA